MSVCLCVCVLMSQRYEKRYPVCLSPKKFSLRKRYLVCLSPHFWKDTWSVCHLKNSGALHPVLCFNNIDSGMLQPPTPTSLFSCKKDMEGWIKTKFTCSDSGALHPPKPPVLPQPPTSLFRSNRYGVLNEKPNLDSGVLHPIRKDIRSVCHLKMNSVCTEHSRWEVCERYYE